MTSGRHLMANASIQALGFFVACWIGMALAGAPDFSYWEFDSGGRAKTAALES